MKQEYKVVNTDDGSEVFFFTHSFKSSYQHAIEYMERNKGKFNMKLFRLNTSDFGPKWIESN